LNKVVPCSPDTLRIPEARQNMDRQSGFQDIYVKQQVKKFVKEMKRKCILRWALGNRAMTLQDLETVLRSRNWATVDDKELKLDKIGIDNEVFRPVTQA
jgi:hypothetical protein